MQVFSTGVNGASGMAYTDANPLAGGLYRSADMELARITKGGCVRVHHL